jgi:hypothetical protein
LANKIGNLFNLLDPLYQNESLAWRKQCKKEIIQEFKNCLLKMASEELLSHNLKCIKSGSENLIFNNAYCDFLPIIKRLCWDAYKNRLIVHSKLFIYYGLELAVFNSGVVSMFFSEPIFESAPENVLNKFIYFLCFTNSLGLASNSYTYLELKTAIKSLECYKE